ncbi:MAG TPA: cyclic peptide export ABC transporter [Thermoanaerobaculia bacterium]|jgi:putative ATP-binding cassette transporter|nr:cyclic peptide export ABC transporter [Thermoanaerobaculia bacterium]
MVNLIKLLGFLIRATDGSLRFARLQTFLLIGTGVIAGLASTGLLAVINAKLARSGGAAGDLAWMFVGLCVVLPLARFASTYFLAVLSQGIVFDLRMSLCRRILAAPLRALEEVGPARLLATLTEDIGTITTAMTTIPLLCLQATVVAGCLAYLGWLSWKLLLIVLVAVAVGVVSYQAPLRRAFLHFGAAREDWDQVFEHLRGITSGTKELKVHRRRREAFFAQKLEPSSMALRQHNVEGTTIAAVANSWGQVIFFVVIGLVLFVLPSHLVLGQPVVTGFTLIILYMLTPLDVLLNLIPSLGRAVVSAKKVERLGLSLADKATEGDRGSLALPSWHSLQLAAATHTFYREEKDECFTLGPIDLEIKAGELVFVVGGNGSGKTTLAKIILGLYTPESGGVRLNGALVTDQSRDLYRQLFSVVFSDFFLFDALLGLERPRLDESARRYLTKLHLDRKVRVEGGMLSTLDLSQGQRKRLALLTAYLEDRSIYLFDEWAADQDPQFKEIFYLQLLPELKQRGKTVIVISHDDHYYRVADRIVKLDYGQVVYDGGVLEYLEWLAAVRDFAPSRVPAVEASSMDSAG